MLKKQLTIEERFALSRLIDFIQEVGLFDYKDYDGYFFTRQTLDLNCFSREYWELCLNANV